MSTSDSVNRRRAILATAAGLATAAVPRAFATDEPRQAQAPAEDVKSLDAITTALYDVISGPKGKARDWDRFRALFAPGARLIPCVAKGPDGKPATRAFTVDEFAERAGRSSADRGFYESEISRKVQRFGHLAHVFSTYESREAPDAPPFSRGINSIQLFWDETRWWVQTIYWDAESPGQPIPAEYLGKS